MLTIDVGLMPDEKTIELFDVSGRVVLSKTSKNALFNIELSPFEPGTYTVKIIVNNSIYTTEKFTIQRK